METQFTAEITEDADEVLIVAAGEIDVASCERLHEAIVPHPGRRVVLDLAAVTFMDSAGIGTLVHAQQVLDLQGGSLTVRDPSEATRRVFELTGLTSVLLGAEGRAD